MAAHKKTLINISNAIKMLSAHAVEKAKSGHPGTPIGASNIMATLFANHLHFNPFNPSYSNRDRFVLSAGHACVMLYSALHLFGYKKITLESLKNLRQLHSITSGHPEFDIEAGVEVTTGPLGEGIAMSVGLGIAEKVMNTKFPDIINHNIYAFVGDGCLMEGVSYEALSLAGHLNLDNLIVIYDKNNITIDGDLSLTSSENITQRMEASNFYVQEIDGHDFNAIDKALHNAKAAKKPSFIIANTTIAKHAGSKAGTASSHGSPIGESSIKDLKQNIAWEYDDFIIPNFIYNEAQNAIKDNIDKANLWQNSLKNKSQFHDYNQYTNSNIKFDLEKLANETIKNKPEIATRLASGKVLENLIKDNPYIIGGSADLSSSNNTITSSSDVIGKDKFEGNYIYYGVREHAMGAIMNGLSCYDNGIIPYGGTFLVFSDFMRPAIRLSALMKRQVIYVFTHDSISLGGDGPTHQPVEHIESLRIIPGTLVLRPADLIETIECYDMAMSYKDGPSILILGRSNVPTLRTFYDKNNNLSNMGGYILEKHEHSHINLIASGSEVSIIKDVQNILLQENIRTNVISVPCLEKLANNTQYKDFLFKDKHNFLFGTSTMVGWKEKLEIQADVYAINSFGKSGTPEQLMSYFGFTKENLYNFVKSKL